MWTVVAALSWASACAVATRHASDRRPDSRGDASTLPKVHAGQSSQRPNPGAAPAATGPSACVPADWSARKLAPLLRPGKTPNPARADRHGAALLVFKEQCTDSPEGAAAEAPAPVVIDGVEVRLVEATPAGSSGRGWAGAQCAFELRLADRVGAPVRLGAREVPPFTTISALVRSGAAAWLSVSFNGYTREFPRGGNRVIAVDLCAGRVVWQSTDGASNGGLLLVDDLLLSPYGFTSEPRSLFVFDARSGAVVQRLPIIENICPSTSWAPRWTPGDRCDAPGQAVGAASSPRIEGGLFLVDTNTGSSAFELR